MIKMVFCARRLPELTREQFHDYWLNHHGPLFAKYAKEYKAVRYIQGHTLSSPLNKAIRQSRSSAEEYDGVGEIWWESETAFIEAVNSEEVAKLRGMFIEDESRFVDLKNSSVFFVEDHVLVSPESML